MNENANRARIAHGTAGVLAWTTLAALLALVPAADASTRHFGAAETSTAVCHATQSTCLAARTRLRMR
jgi:hypothetical protein